jgi:hypothetical protein
MSAPEYPCATLYDMAAIPEEALPRFLAELPDILAQCRRLLDVQRQFNAAFEGEFELLPKDPTWIDDDKGQCTVTVAMDGDDLAIQTTGPLSRGAA